MTTSEFLCLSPCKTFLGCEQLLKASFFYPQHPLHGLLVTSAPRSEVLRTAVSLSSGILRRECAGVCTLLQQRVSQGQTAQQTQSRPNRPRALGDSDGITGRGGGGAGAEPLESATEISDHQAVLI